MLNWLRRFSVYGDFWMRYLHWGARHCPWFMEPVFMALFSFLFWVACGTARNAVARNLSVILPGTSGFGNQFRALRVFWNFAWTITDLAHVRNGEDVITWEITGMPHLQELQAKEDGAILLTAHMGNYDVAAPIFAHKFKRPIHMVRAPERLQENQEYQKKKRDRQTSDTFIIHYNEPGNMLGLELARAVDEGGIVAIQGDRVLFDVSPMTMTFKDGVEWNIPRGPFILASVARTTIHPVFIIRVGYRRYRVHAEPSYALSMEGCSRNEAQAVAARQWNEVLRKIIEANWQQWFVFEDVFAFKEQGELSLAVSAA
jgi:lauroyl/myristoyl acyltransferase